MLFLHMFLRLVTASVIVVTLSTVSFVRSSFYRDGVSLLSDTAGKSPNKERVLNNFAFELLQAGRFGEALPLLERIIASNPDNVTAKTSMALVFCGLGLKADAERVFTEIEERHPLSKESAFARKMIISIRRGEI
jgi:thioredoxin-like negative regulator of GroEL